MRPPDFTAVIDGSAIVPSRIESGGFCCWAVCGACKWTGPRRGGTAAKAHDTAKADLIRHYRDVLAA